MKSNLIYFFV
jgi:hypothetical protein